MPPKRRMPQQGGQSRRPRYDVRTYYDRFRRYMHEAATLVGDEESAIGQFVNYMDPTIRPMLEDPSYDNFRRWFNRNPRAMYTAVVNIPAAARQAIDNMLPSETEDQPTPVPSTPPHRPLPYQPPAPRKPQRDPDHGPPPEYDPEEPHTGQEKPLPQNANMSTAYSDSYCTLDLGSHKVPHKGGKYGDHVPSDVIGQWVSKVYEAHGMDQSVKNTKKATWLGSYDLGGPVADANTVTSIPNYSTSATNQWMFIGKFNSALHQFKDISEVMGEASDAATAFHPAYTADQVSPTDTNKARQLIAYKNQVMYLRLKNVSHSDRDGGEAPATGYLDETPIHIKLLMVQAKHDMHYVAGAAETGYQAERLQEAWQALFDGPTSGDKFHPGDGADQPLWITLRDNPWFGDNWKVLHVKKFTLCPGQEAILTYHLLPTQILSYQHLMRNRPANRPLVIKKGEIQFMYSFHGALGIYKETGPPEVYDSRIKPTRLAYWAYHKYEAAPVNVGFETTSMYRQIQTYAAEDEVGIDPDTRFA